MRIEDDSFKNNLPIQNKDILEISSQSSKDHKSENHETPSQFPIKPPLNSPVFISREEMKEWLAILMRTPEILRITKGNFVDIKG